MGKRSNFLKWAGLALVMALGLAHSVKADGFTGTTFTDVSVYYVGGPSDPGNPFGLTNNCGCANPDPAGAGTPFELATVTFTANGISVVPTPTSTGFIQAILTGGTSTAQYSVAGGNLTADLGTLMDFGAQTSPNGWCSGYPISNQSCPISDSGAGLAYVSTASGNVFTLTDTSLALAFQLGPSTNTPEPSSLMMLGSGLLGLMGFGFRRKGII